MPDAGAPTGRPPRSRSLIGGLWGRLTKRRHSDRPVQAESAHDFAFTAIDGAPMKLSDFRGRALLLVNTATQCGFAAQYDALQHLHATYHARGLTVIGIPSNDFGGQEPGDEAQIQSVCRARFNVTFPLTSKIALTGRDAHPFYRWAGHHLGPIAQPRWNFHKYLVNREGRLVDWFSTVTNPTSNRVVGAIERVLGD